MHESALTCPYCGGVQNPKQQNNNNKLIWMPIVSLVFGIISFLALFDNSAWGEDEILGLGIFSVVGVVLGIASIANQAAGKGMAIAGLAMSIIALLVLIGMS
jgi:hypothetical protein